MRIVKIEKNEKIILSDKEVDTWYNFMQTLEFLERESESPYILDLATHIQKCIAELYEEVIEQ